MTRARTRTEQHRSHPIHARARAHTRVGHPRTRPGGPGGLGEGGDTRVPPRCRSTLARERTMGLSMMPRRKMRSRSGTPGLPGSPIRLSRTCCMAGGGAEEGTHMGTREGGHGGEGGAATCVKVQPGVLVPPPFLSQSLLSPPLWGQVSGSSGEHGNVPSSSKRRDKGMATSPKLSPRSERGGGCRERAMRWGGDAMGGRCKGGAMQLRGGRIRGRGGGSGCAAALQWRGTIAMQAGGRGGTSIILPHRGGVTASPEPPRPHLPPPRSFPAAPG